MLRSRRVFALLILTAIPALGADDKPPTAPLKAFVIEGSRAKPADSDAPLAEGWPGGTQPGMIEVKKYPAYRSAVAKGMEAGYGADNLLFFPLFTHISKSEIAMTTPVVSTYGPGLEKEPKGKLEMSMEFVYRSPTMGQTGPGVGTVKVEDHPASAFVCLGVQGDIDSDRMQKAIEALKNWLAEHKGEWVEDGPIRRLGYHGPMTRRNERLWEVQIPVKPVTPPAPEAPKN